MLTDMNPTASASGSTGLDAPQRTNQAPDGITAEARDVDLSKGGGGGGGGGGVENGDVGATTTINQAVDVDGDAEEEEHISDATITIRIIKSFEYRTFKNILLRNLDLRSVKVGDIMEMCKKEIATKGAYKPYRALVLDTLKLYTLAHGHKTINLIINLDHDDWILDDPDKTLFEIGAKHETEFSFFNRAAYEAFKLDPQVKWD